MRRILAPAVLPVIAVLALSGCVATPAAPAVSEDREVETVSAVVFNSSGDLIITVGEPSLTITGPSDALERISSESGDDLLVIAATGPGVAWGDLRYELSMPALTTVRVAGSGDVEVDFSTAPDVHVDIDGSGDVEGSGIDSATVSVSIGGSGDIELSGATEGVMARLDGSGEIDLGDLVSADAFVDLAGSGEVRVHATRTLRVDLSGSGTVRYSGGAELVSDITGSGEVVED